MGARCQSCLGDTRWFGNAFVKSVKFRTEIVKCELKMDLQSVFFILRQIDMY